MDFPLEVTEFRSSQGPNTIGYIVFPSFYPSLSCIHNVLNLARILVSKSTQNRKL